MEGRRATNTTLHYYLSKDSTYSHDDKEFKDWRDRLPTFDVNAIEDDHANLDAPDTPGDCYIIARAERVRNERNTANNYDSVKITVLPPPVPDLVITLRSDMSLVYLDEWFRLIADVRNQEKKDAPSRSIVHYYSSTDAIISPDDAELDTGRTWQLDAADSDDDIEGMHAPKKPGDYYYYAYVDSVEGEVNTDNSYSDVIKVSVRGPDLVIDSVSVDYLSLKRPAVFPNGKIELQVTVRNQGTDDSHSTKLRYSEYYAIIWV